MSLDDQIVLFNETKQDMAIDDKRLTVGDRPEEPLEVAHFLDDPFQNSGGNKDGGRVSRCEKFLKLCVGHKIVSLSVPCSLVRFNAGPTVA